MKTVSKFLKKSLVCILLFLSSYSYSQTCPIGLTITPATAGVAYLYATMPGTNSAMYAWNLGNGTSTLGINLYSVIATYTSNGNYTISVTYTDQVNGCTSSTTGTTTISTVCSLSVNATLPNSQNLCNGSATVTNIGFCGPASYTWYPGPISQVNTNMCLGTYTVMASSSGSCCPVVATTFTMTAPPCNISSSNSNINTGGGNVSFSSTVTGTTSGTTYTLNFGDGSPPTYTTTTIHTYSANGNYTATLNIRNNYLCSSLYIIPLSVTNSTYCNIIPSYTYTVGANGNVSFSGTSTGTTVNSGYFWKFGDGSNTVSGVNTSHTYSNNGVYSATLIAYKIYPNISCVDSVAVPITITNACVLSATFSTSSFTGTTIYFNDASTGTVVGSSYLWDFGDGSPTSTLTNVSHSYSANGNYTVSLIIVNNPACYDTAKTVVPVNIIPCQLTANYAHIVGNNGQVNFTSSSTGTSITTSYFWDFGDGVYSLVANPSHTYLYTGAYAVKLKVTDGTCRDSTITSINVTGLPCVANAVFSLSAGLQPQYWIATPAYPWNVTSASWNWGDGSVSSGLYSSHIYSVAGTYSICLTVTTSCGATNSYCSSSTVYKTSEPQSMIYVNVMKPGLVNAIANVTATGPEFSLFPNPAPGDFNLSFSGLSNSPVTVSIYNLTGELIYHERMETTEREISKKILLDHENGIYLVTIMQDDLQLRKKLVISKN